MPEVVANVWPMTTVQTCIVHYADLGSMPTWWRELLVVAA
jgi:transposase-like protein